MRMIRRNTQHERILEFNGIKMRISLDSLDDPHARILFYVGVKLIVYKKEATIFLSKQVASKQHSISEWLSIVRSPML